VPRGFEPRAVERRERGLMRIGDLHLALRELPEALNAHIEALKQSTELLASDPGNTRWKRLVAVSNGKLFAVAMAERDYEEAFARASAKLEIANKLFDLDPRNLYWRRDKCGSLRQIASALRALHDPERMRIYIDSAVGVCRETASLYPHDAAAAIDLVVTLYRAASDRSADEAASLLREALVTLQDLDKAGTLPRSNANWAPFISKRLEELEFSSTQP
jgi:hypothetical protein